MPSSRCPTYNELYNQAKKIVKGLYLNYVPDPEKSKGQKNSLMMLMLLEDRFGLKSHFRNSEDFVSRVLDIEKAAMKIKNNWRIYHAFNNEHSFFFKHDEIYCLKVPQKIIYSIIEENKKQQMIALGNYEVSKRKAIQVAQAELDSRGVTVHGANKLDLKGWTPSESVVSDCEILLNPDSLANEYAKTETAEKRTVAKDDIASMPMSVKSTADEAKPSKQSDACTYTPNDMRKSNSNIRSTVQVSEPKSLRRTKRDDRQQIAARLRKILNNCVSERDPFAWKKSIEQSGPYELSMIEFAPNRGGWNVVDWSLHNSVAMIGIAKNGNYPKFVVPIGFSPSSPQVREWYDVEGEGYIMRIKKLPTAKRTTDSHEETYALSKGKGIIKLSHV